MIKAQAEAQRPLLNNSKM